MMPFPLLLVLSFAGSMIPAVVLQVERKNWIWAGIGGMLGQGLAIYMTAPSSTPGVLQVFAGAFLVALYSEWMARVRKTPAISFCIPGIFPLVPGIDAYKTMQHVMNEEMQLAASSAIRTVILAFSIAFGIMTVTSLFRMGKMIRDGKKAH